MDNWRSFGSPKTQRVSKQLFMVHKWLDTTLASHLGLSSMQFNTFTFLEDDE